MYTLDGTIAYTGKAFVDASTVALSSSNAEPQSVSFGHEFQTVELKNRSGKTVGMAAINESQTVQVTIIVHAGTGGTLKDGVIELQGDQVAPALAALAQGKKEHDKRDTEKDRDWNRQKQRIVRDNVKQ